MKSLAPMGYLIVLLLSTTDSGQLTQSAEPANSAPTEKIERLEP